MGDVGDPGRGWNVHLSVSADEGRALLEATRGLVERGASLVMSPDGDIQELVLFSREDAEDRARQAVIDVYQRLRRVAGLEPEVARVVSLERPSRRPGARRRRHRHDVVLIEEAKRVLRSGSHFEWVVVLAQTACEVYVRDILDRQAAQLGADAVARVERLPSANLDNASVRRVSKISPVTRCPRTRNGGATIRPTRNAATGSCTPAPASPASTPRTRSRPRTR